MAIIYVSGPMSNLPNHNHDEFNRWARILRDRGHQVINPAENDGGSIDKSWHFYMELDINNILMVELVVVLPGWEHSTGARLELAIAQALQKPIYHVKEFADGKRNPLKLKIQVVIDNG